MTDNAAFYLQLAQAREAAAAAMRPGSAEADRLRQQARRYRATAARLEHLEAPQQPTKPPRERGRKLHIDQVADIIRAAAAGETHSKIAARYGVHADAVSRIYRRNTWAHVLPDVPRPKIEKRKGVRR